MDYWNQGEELNDGKFIVEQLLGIGGFGFTYIVRQTRNNKLFALKTLNLKTQSKPDFQQLQAKFINEAIALASCRHPNIVRVYPQGFLEGELWCMVMEYIEGKDLASHLLDFDKALEEKQAVEIITKVSKALSFVHEAGLLHRDIKPANILLRSSDLEPILIDFGIAREYNSERSMSMTSYRTLSFAPIEQFKNRGNFGPWTDVYSLAATVYNLLTNIEPIASIYREHAPLKSPKEINSNISDRVNKAILKGMELEPKNRPQSVAEWLSLLNPTQDRIVADNLPATFEIFEFDTVKINSLGKVTHTEHHSAKYFTEDLGNDVTLDAIEIPGGTFMMGSSEEKSRLGNKNQQHQVTVPSFYIAKFPITQAQWRQVAAMPRLNRELQSDPSQFKGRDLPVENVSWYDAVEFCQRLSKLTAKEFKLPSEAQWEYACRANTTTPFHFGATITTDLANYNGKYTYLNEFKGEYRQKTTPVGRFEPNAFGLYDMHGNVWEWCEDSWHENYEGAPDNSNLWTSSVDNTHVLRGGSWGSRPGFCLSAHRDRFIADNSNNFVGFRCVVTKTL